MDLNITFEKKEVGPYNRLAAKQTNNGTVYGNTVLEIQPDDDTLILKFIRTGVKKGVPVSNESKNYTFDKLMKYFLCYAKQNNYEKVKLDDDSEFTDKEDSRCKFKSLYYRAFMNKDSIYKSYGYEPTDINKVNDYKKIIYEFKVEDAKQLSNYLYLKSNDMKEKIKAIPEQKDENKFGDWLLKQSCSFYNEVFNRFSELSYNYLKPPRDAALHINIEVNERNKNIIEFLKAFQPYHKIHENLIRKINGNECEQSGGKRKLRKNQKSFKKLKSISKSKNYSKYKKNTKKHN